VELNWEGVGQEDGCTFSSAMHGEMLLETLIQGPSE